MIATTSPAARESTGKTASSARKRSTRHDAVNMSHERLNRPMRTPADTVTDGSRMVGFAPD